MPSSSAWTGLAALAFPAISTGAYGFPFLRAARIAVGTVLETLPETPSVEKVVFVCRGTEAAETCRQVVAGLLPPRDPGVEKPGDRPPLVQDVAEEDARDRIEAHLVTIESAYGIRISNFIEVMDRIAGATGDEGEILAIATAISSYIAVHLRSPEMEIPGPFLEQAIRRFTGRGRSGPEAAGDGGTSP